MGASKSAGGARPEGLPTSLVLSLVVLLVLCAVTLSCETEEQGGNGPGADGPGSGGPGAGDPDSPADAPGARAGGAEICTDNIDNNGDEFVDCYDPACGCAPEVCGDNVDNDGDGLMDCLDPECGCAPEVCDDNVDNDGDELMDCLDPECGCAPEVCDDNVDNDGDGLMDCLDPDCDCQPEVCFDEIDNDGDGLVDCTMTPDPECPCEMLGEGCRLSERIALVHCPESPLVVLPGGPPVDSYTCEEVAESPHLLNPYDTVAYYGPMTEQSYVALNLLYRSGRKVVIFANRGMVDETWRDDSGAFYWDLWPHFHNWPIDGWTITRTSTNLMSEAFVKERYLGAHLAQMNTTSAFWCGDLSFGWGHFHGYRREDGVARGVLFFVGLYSPTADVIGFGDPFVAAHLSQPWDPGYGTSDNCGLLCDAPAGWGYDGSGKPVIYLYPEEEERVTVQLDYDGELVTTYPEIDEELGGWEVVASPDGSLVDVRDGEEYSYLFWNGVTSAFVPDFSEGFIVRGEDTVDFLQETLSEIGLLPYEYNELIIYWLPWMEHHRYNLIHFAGQEYTSIARMRITPEPDSVLRVFMVFSEVDEPFSIRPQTFPPFERTGFTVVEWGGSEIGGDWHVVM